MKMKKYCNNVTVQRMIVVCDHGSYLPSRHELSCGEESVSRR